MLIRYLPPVHIKITFRQGLFVILAGFSFGLTVGSQVFSTQSSIWWIIPGFVLFSFIGAGLVYFVLLRQILPRMRRYPRRTRLLWILFCLLAGFILVLTIPLNIYPLNNTVVITATGDENAQAKSSEVWLASIFTEDRTIFDDVIGICHGRWTKKFIAKEIVLVSYHNQPSRLVCNIKADENIVLEFGTHPWSGIVQVVYDGQSITEDLFSENESNRLVTLAVELDTEQRLIKYTLIIVDALWLGILLLVVSMYFVRRQGSAKSGNKDLPWYGYAIIFSAVWLIYLLAYWPGFLSPDTISQWREIFTGQYTNWHPAFHTWYMALVSRNSASLASISLVQIVALSIVMGWGLATIRRLGAPVWLTRLIAAWLILCPAFGLTVIFHSKDIPYSICVLALTILVFLIVISEGKKLTQPTFWISLGVVTALVVLFRHNGAAIALGTLSLVLLAYHRQWRPLLASIVVTFGLWWGITNPVYRLMHVNDNPDQLGTIPATASFYSYLIRTHELHKTPFLPDELAFYQEILPAIQNPHSSQLAILPLHEKELADLAIKLSVRNPYVTLDYLWSKTTGILQITRSPLDRVEYLTLAIEENPYGFRTESKIPLIKRGLTAITEMTMNPVIEIFVWRNAFWFYLFLFAIAVACLRTRSGKYWLVALPVVLNALPLIMFSGGQIYRYIIPTIWVSSVLSGYLLFIPSTETEPVETSAAQPLQSIEEKKPV